MKHFTNRLLSAAAAAALGCSLCSGAVDVFAKELVPPTVSYAPEELADVIVRLNGSSVLASPDAQELGTDYMDTDEAQAAEIRLRAAQDAAAAHIRRLYPELEIRRRYTLSANAFSCTIPECLIDEVRSDPLVAGVEKVQTAVAQAPQLTTARELGGVPAFTNSTGLTGAGQVIAVIDTEFDVSHDMFAPMEDVYTALTKNDISNIKSKTGFSADIDVNQAYISNKVPFAYDYADDSPYILACEDDYHGTHVSGIAAGNHFVSGDGREVSGVAPDAQLLMLKVYGLQESGGFSVDDEDIAAAIEDAVRLKADVINMSFGRVYEYLDSVFYAEAIETAANAGVIICASAGNCSNAQFGSGDRISPEDVDTGTLSEPSIFPQVISVASADNIISATNYLVAGEAEYPYCECGNMYCIETLGSGEYDVYYTNASNYYNMKAENVRGKLVFYDGYDSEYFNLAYKAFECEAAGLIIADDSCNGLYESYLFTCALPVAVLSTDDAAAMKNANISKVSFKSTASSIENTETVSDYSSYGVPTSLDIKPEIMGIGGSVLSAAYGNSLSLMSGTSMASPYLAGCSALLNQYLDSQGSKLTGYDKVVRVKNILMNSAVPYTDGDLYVSPRRQGAGLVALDEAINDKVIITGSSGLAKIELRDWLIDTFSFEFDVTNISSDDVTFDTNALVLTTDGTAYNEYYDQICISGSTMLLYDDDLPDTITVPAGETVTQKVTVKLSPEQISEQISVFRNGFFVEGFLRLAGAQNCCALTVPVLGFYGDWTQVPNISESRYPSVIKVTMGNRELRTDISLAKLARLYWEHLSADSYYDSFDLSMPSMFPDTLEYDLTPEELERYRALFDGVTYFSPNYDSYGEHIGLFYVPTREADFSELDIYDSNGELVCGSDYEGKNSYTTQLTLPGYDIHLCDEGSYKGVLSSYIRYGNAAEKPQKKEFDIVIDKTDPEVNYNVTEEDGKRLLTITAKDANLDGIYLSGVRAGKLSDDSRRWFNAMYIASSTLAMDRLLFNEESVASRYTEPLPPAEISPFRLMLDGAGFPNEYYNFCDIIPAEPDENGSFTTTYDITGLDEVSLSVLDRSMNEYTATIGNAANSPSFFLPGLWYGSNENNDVFYEFRDDNTLKVISTYDKSETEMTYSLKDGEAQFALVGSLTLNSATVQFLNRESAVITWTATGVSEKIDFIPAYEAENMHFLSDIELSDLALKYYDRIHDDKADKASCEFSKYDGSITITVTRHETDGDHVLDVYSVSRQTGSGVDIVGEPIDLAYTLIGRDGVWSAYVPTMDYGEPRFFRFVDETSGFYAYQDNGIEWPFDFTIEGNTIHFGFPSFGDFSTVARTATIEFLDPYRAQLYWENGFFEELTLHPEVNEISELNFLTDDQLREYAAAYYTSVTGLPATDISTYYAGNDGEVTVYIHDPDDVDRNVLEAYTVNFFTGKGIDMNGNDIDLRDAAPGPALGDVNGDDKVDAKDASAVLAAYAKSSTGADNGLTAAQAKAANVNGDSLIDAKDASFILSYYALASTAADEVPTMEEFMASKLA